MSDRSPTATDLLTRHPQWIAHLRQAHRNDRLLLVTGSGFGGPLGVPDWSDLPERLRTVAEVECGAAPDGRPAARLATAASAILDGDGSDATGDGSDATGDGSDATGTEPRRDLLDALRTALYETVDRSTVERADHPYFDAAFELARGVGTVVSYGLDSTFQLLASAGPDDERRYQTIYEPGVPSGDAEVTVYKPERYLPLDPLAGFTTGFETDPETGDGDTPPMGSRIDHVLRERTCLVVAAGDDRRARLYRDLRRINRSNPAHVHYGVRLRDCQTPEHPTDGDPFETYGLRSTALSSAEWESLVGLVTCDRETFLARADDAEVRTKWVYYVTGVPGVGKTSVVSRFRTTGACAEWADEPPDLLRRPHTELDEHERQRADNWVHEQHARRNERLDGRAVGVYVADRGPLDPLTFTDDESVATEAADYRTKLGNVGGPEKLVPGHVVVLEGDLGEVARRLSLRQTEAYTVEELSDLHDKTRKYYPQQGVETVECADRVAETVRKVARVVFDGSSYTTADLDGRLSSLQRGGHDAVNDSVASSSGTQSDTDDT